MDIDSEPFWLVLADEAENSNSSLSEDACEQITFEVDAAEQDGAEGTRKSQFFI